MSSSSSLLAPGSTVFVTGASGWVGSHTVKELVAHGYKVVGLARSDEAATKIEGLGASAVRGTIEDLDVLKKAAASSDAVVHLGFIHDFSNYARSIEIDGAAIRAFGQALEGSGKTFVNAGATTYAGGLGRLGTERDLPKPGANPRGPSEALTLSFADKGIRSISLRLSPTVHGRGDHGFVPFIIASDRKAGVAAYPGDGNSRWTGVHVEDAAVLVRLALERSQAGAVVHAAEDEGFTQRALAEVIGQQFSLPVRSIPPDQVGAHFGWLAYFIGLDGPVSSQITRETTGWKPTHPTLFEDLRAGAYDNE